MSQHTPHDEAAAATGAGGTSVWQASLGLLLESEDAPATGGGDDGGGDDDAAAAAAPSAATMAAAAAGSQARRITLPSRNRPLEADS